MDPPFSRTFLFPFSRLRPLPDGPDAKFDGREGRSNCKRGSGQASAVKKDDPVDRFFFSFSFPFFFFLQLKQGNLTLIPLLEIETRPINFRE